MQLFHTSLMTGPGCVLFLACLPDRLFPAECRFQCRQVRGRVVFETDSFFVKQVLHLIDKGRRRFRQFGKTLYLPANSVRFHVSELRENFGLSRETHPRTDLLLVEPNRGDDEIFFTNIFSFSSRVALCDHAYRLTRADLRKRATELDEVLHRHGMSLNHEVLQKRNRSLLDSLNAEWSGHSKIGRNLSRILDDLDWNLDRLAG